MSTRPVRTVTLSLAAALAAATVSACGSDAGLAAPTSSAQIGSTSGSAPTSASASSSSSSSASSAATSGGGSAAGDPVDAAQLISQLRGGLGSIRTVHLDATTVASGRSEKISADEQVSDGKLVALDLTGALGTGTLKIRLVDGKTYGQLPRVGTSARPWVVVTKSSSNSTVRLFATSLSSIQSTASLDQSLKFLTAARSVDNEGTTTVNGTSATHYAVVVDFTKLPADYPNRNLIIGAGVKTAPVEVYLDDQGRPVRLDTKITISGSTTTNSTVFSKYNQPVSISAPPAGQISPS